MPSSHFFVFCQSYHFSVNIFPTSCSFSLGISKLVLPINFI